MSEPSRGYFRMGLVSGVGWPSVEQTVEFKGVKFRLMPETNSLAPSIVVRLDEPVRPQHAGRNLAGVAVAVRQLRAKEE